MRVRRVIVASGLVVGLVGSVMAGDLNPPAGPIEATMVTLDQVEPRWIIDTVPPSTDAVHHITQPGHYVMTSDITVPSGKSGIVVELAPGLDGRVSIDCNGFSIVGQPGSVHAVHFKGGGGGGGGSGGYRLCYSTNPGTLWSDMGGSGLVVDSGGTVSVSGVTVVQCGGDGIHIENTERCSLAVSVDGCGGNGISASQVGFVEFNPARDQLKGGPRHRVKNCAGNGLVATQCGSVSVADYSFIDVALDGMLFVDTLDIALSSVSIEDGGANGVSVTNARRLSACCIGSSGEDGVEVRVARVLGHGIVVIGGSDDVLLEGFVVNAALDGIRVEDTARCDISAGVVGAGGNGISMVRCADASCRVAIKTKGTGADKNRVAQTGGDGLHFLDCGTVSVHGMAASSCQGDGLHVSGASSVSVSDWRDDDCDGDGIEISAGLASPPVVHLRDTFSNRAGGNGATIVCKMGRVELARCTGATGHGIDVEGDDIELSECTTNSNGQCGVNGRVGRLYRETGGYANDNGWQGTFLAPSLQSVQEKANKTKCSARGNGGLLPGGGAGFEFSGISSVEMHECDSSGNTGSGVVIGDLDRDGRLDLVTCSSNGLYGIHVPGPSSGLPGGRFHVSRALADANGVDGMYLEGTTGGEVSDCVFSNNAGLGLHVLGSSHVVRSNSCTSNMGGAIFVLMPGNVVGPLVDELTVAGNCNPAANYVH